VTRRFIHVNARLGRWGYADGMTPRPTAERIRMILAAGHAAQVETREHCERSRAVVAESFRLLAWLAHLKSELLRLPPRLKA
jgi:hypothetical protein